MLNFITIVNGIVLSRFPPLFPFCVFFNIENLGNLSVEVMLNFITIVNGIVLSRFPPFFPFLCFFQY